MAQDRQQEADSFEGLFVEHWDRMVRLATLLVGSQQVAEDLVQDAFLAVGARLGSVATPAAYLRAAVVNRCRNHGRRVAVQRRHRIDTALTVEPPAVDETWQAILRLSPRKRVAIVLRFYEDLTVEGVAEVMGCRPGTAGSLIHRALHELRETLDEH